MTLTVELPRLDRHASDQVLIARARGLFPHLRERAARHCEHDQLGIVERGFADRGGRDPAQVEVGDVPRIVRRPGDDAHLLGIAAGKRDLVSEIAQQARECRSPGTAAENHDSHGGRIALCVRPDAK